VEKLPRIVAELKGILERFLQALSCIDAGSVCRSHPRLAKREWVASISINSGCVGWRRPSWLSAGVPEDSPVRNWRIRGEIPPPPEGPYGPRPAAYEVKKFSGNFPQLADSSEAVLGGLVKRRAPVSWAPVSGRVRRLCALIEALRVGAFGRIAIRRVERSGRSRGEREALRGFPGFTNELQPGPVKRFGKS
jgi:hypothetical protein